MRWWQTQACQGHIIEALAHLNAVRGGEAGGRVVEICEGHFKALNKLWTAHRQHEQHDKGDAESINRLLGSLTLPERRRLASDESLNALARLEPLILNHDALNKKGYRPGDAISPALLRDAGEEHREFRSAHESHITNSTEESLQRIIKKLSTLSYTIRSNVAHGEKTPYGPDLNKADRDKLVASAILPLLELMIDLVLGEPRRRLIAYGTLRPMGVNSGVLGAMRGVWQEGEVCGTVEEEVGLVFLRWNPTASRTAVSVLLSEDLPEAWSRIDAFEGPRYKRRLIPVEVDGRFEIGNAYLIT